VDLMRDAEITKKAILDAAQSVFLEQGFAKASLSDIAEKSGVTKSLIHHHFGSKEGLWTQVKRRAFSVYFDQQMAAIENQPADMALLRHSIELYFRSLQAHPDLVRMLAWMALERDTTTPEEFNNLNKAGVAKLREAQLSGTLRDDIEPYLILAVFTGLAEHWFLHRHALLCCMGLDPADQKTDTEYLDAILKIFFEGVEPRS
jgi:TetR/AcrR family transcriptional regulator